MSDFSECPTKDPEYFEMLKHREIYDAYRLDFAIDWLKDLQYLVFKSLDFDDDMVDKFAEALKRTKANYQEYAVDIRDFKAEDQDMLEAVHLVAEQIIHRNRGCWLYQEQVKLKDALTAYPIDIKQVYSDYRLTQHEK